MNSIYLHWCCSQVYTSNRPIMWNGLCLSSVPLPDLKISESLQSLMEWKGGMLHSKIKYFALQIEIIPVNSSLDTTADGDNPPEILSNFNARNSIAADFKWWCCTYNCGLSSWNIGGGLRYLDQFYRLGACHTCCYLQRQHRQPQ